MLLPRVARSAEIPPLMSTTPVAFREGPEKIVCPTYPQTKSAKKGSHTVLRSCSSAFVIHFLEAFRSSIERGVAVYVNRPWNMVDMLLATVLLGFCLDLSRAWTTPAAAALRKHVNNRPVVARTGTITRTPIRPTPKTPWAREGRAAASEGWGCRFERRVRDVGGVRSVAPLSMAASATSTRSEKTTSLGGNRSVNWPLWYVLPIAPYQRRKTLVKEIVPGKVGFVGCCVCSAHSSNLW